MTDIRELDQGTVERIAAGEVVERPASVVKELVENSLDADADRIDVTVEAGGTNLVRVSDDGVGMTESEVRRAVEEHTTSKIRDIADLEGGVGTLGFRGEALHAIGAVSRLTITTRPHAEKHAADGGARGTELTVEGGDVTGVEPAGCPEGTTVDVTDLFYNVPARRKYLKQESTEFAHVNTVVTSYALANPDVAVSLTHGDRETFATTGSGDLREAVMAVYGREVAQSMITVDGDSVPDGPLDGVSGLVSHPETNRASREYLSTFVNGRYVTAAAVRDAVVDAYDTQLAPDRYPFAVVDLAVDPADVDVNVHPRKMEVRFADEGSIQDQVRTAVESALLDEGLIRSSAPRGKSAPDQTEIRPGERSAGDGDGDNEGDGAAFTSGADTGPSAPDDTRPGSSDDARRPRQFQPDASSSHAGGTPSRSSTSGDTESASDRSTARGPSASGESTSERSAGGSPAEHDGNEGESRKFARPHEQTRLDGTDAEGPAEYDSLPSMRVLGQLHDTYIVAETAEGLVLVDQHAADERINYERLRESLDGDTATQALADPVEFSLTAREAELFEVHADALATIGFRADRVDDRTVEVRTVPTLVTETAAPELLRDVLSEFVGGEEAAAGTVEAAADDLLADLACYPSITGNTSLTEGSVVDLLSALDECENPYACPHGRPTVVELDSDELAARFERDYPGHGS